MAKNFRFNLFHKKGGSFVSDAVLFFNTYAKYIIIITQLVVLSVFFIKIVLDQTIIDLKESIDQKNQIILAAIPMIESSAHLSQKMTELNGLVDQTAKQYLLLTGTLKNIPQSIMLERIVIRPKVLSITGHTFEAVDIKRLQLRLEKIKLGQVTINRITKEKNIYTFELLVT
jgi:hypothetical protein